MKMKELKLIILAAALLSLGACSSDTDERAQAEVELRFSSTLDLHTRAAYTKTQDTQILNGEKVYAWVDEAKTTGAVEYIQAWALTADGAGKLEGVKKLYPVSGNPVNVYAIHGNFATAPSGTFPTAALNHSVNATQTTDANYAASDLLYATGTNLARQTAAHPLAFSHLLSKIEVYLVAGTGMTDAELATAQVTVLNTKLSTALTLSKTAATLVSIAPSGTIDATTGNAITAKIQSQTDQTVTIEGSAQKAYAFGEAVIVPQYVSSTGAAGGSPVDFVQIKVGTNTYTAQVSNDFEAGKRYVYNVVVNKSGITLTSTILPWGDGGTEVIIAK